MTIRFPSCTLTHYKITCTDYRLSLTVLNNTVANFTKLGTIFGHSGLLNECVSFLDDPMSDHELRTNSKHTMG